MRHRAVSLTDRAAPERLTWAEVRRAYSAGWHQPDTERAHLLVCVTSAWAGRYLTC